MWRQWLAPVPIEKILLIAGDIDSPRRGSARGRVAGGGSEHRSNGDAPGNPPDCSLALPLFVVRTRVARFFRARIHRFIGARIGSLFMALGFGMLGVAGIYGLFGTGVGRLDCTRIGGILCGTRG